MKSNRWRSGLAVEVHRLVSSSIVSSVAFAETSISIEHLLGYAGNVFKRQNCKMASESNDAHAGNSLSATDFPRLPPNHSCKLTEIQSGFVQIKNHQGTTLDPAAIFRIGWALVLREYTENTSVCFGYAFDPGNGKTAGTNGVRPCCIDVTPGRGVGELIDMAHAKVLDHGDGASLSDARNVLVMHSHDGDVKEWKASGICSESEVDGLALVLHCVPKPAGFAIFACYDPVAYDQARVNWLLKHFSHAVTVLSSSAADRTVDQISLCGPEDKAQLAAWNGDIPPYVDACVHDTVKVQILLHPDKEAVCAWDGSLTYDELDRLADAYASRLRALGVQAETLVPFCFDKSKWTPVAMLAILRSGGACVAIDPSHPVERLKVVVRDANARVAIAADKHAAFMRALLPAVVAVTDRCDISALPGPKAASPHPHHPAFVYCTCQSPP